MISNTGNKEVYLAFPGLLEVVVQVIAAALMELFQICNYAYMNSRYKPDTQCSVKCEAGRSSIGKTIVTTSPLSDSRLDLPYTVSITTDTDTLPRPTICELG
jgi:hypothetical protein